MLGAVGKVLVKLIGGTRNERLVRSMHRIVKDRINPLEPRIREMSDERMRAFGEELAARLAKGESPESVMPEAFALIREASRRARDHRLFDEQLIAGQVLYNGNIA